ncbi:MAG: hypothetical protein RL609_112 [Bacteroidota bacterium]|jgi:hypothetical protein
MQRYIPFIGTSLFHFFAAAMLLLGMKSCEKLPPIEPVQYESLSLAALGDFEPGEGEYVDLGAESSAIEAAGGDVQDLISDAAAQTTAQATESSTPTQTPSENPGPTAQEVENAAKSSKINKLFDKKGSNSSAGDTPGGTGIEGNPNGDINGKGVFGGKGNGNKGEWSLKGRGLAKAPSLETKPDFEGTIFVNITVDNAGNVVAATADPIKSKVSGEGFKQLSELAIKAAKATKFSTAADAKKQVGSVVITFKLK